uniref:Uncharacterized protein n=1 Tax=Lotharella globosa TaxID=91324 RepID=A0A7S4DQ90_9EUKA
MTSRFDNPKWARKYPLQGPPNILYITDQDNNVMRMMDLSSLQTSQVAGIGARGYVDGPSAPAVLHQPAGLVLHEPPSASGNLQMYFTEPKIPMIRCVTLKTVALQFVAVFSIDYFGFTLSQERPFEENFVQAIANFLGTDRRRIKIDKITPGSMIVESKLKIITAVEYRECRPRRHFQWSKRLM